MTQSMAKGTGVLSLGRRCYQWRRNVGTDIGSDARMQAANDPLPGSGSVEVAA